MEPGRRLEPKPREPGDDRSRERASRGRWGVVRPWKARWHKHGRESQAHTAFPPRRGREGGLGKEVVSRNRQSRREGRTETQSENGRESIRPTGEPRSTFAGTWLQDGAGETSAASTAAHATWPAGLRRAGRASCVLGAGAGTGPGCGASRQGYQGPRRRGEGREGQAERGVSGMGRKTSKVRQQTQRHRKSRSDNDCGSCPEREGPTVDAVNRRRSSSEWQQRAQV